MENSVNRIAFFEQNESQSQLSAAELTAAETVMLWGPYFMGVEPDPMPYDGDEQYDGPVWTVTLFTVEDRDTPYILASMGGVACERDDPYIRIAVAELAYDSIILEVKKK